MTTDLGTVPEIREFLELSGRDREAAEAVASGLRDAKADNTRRASASAWRRFQSWAGAGGHPALHATAGMQKADNPVRHPIVAEAVRGWSNRAPGRPMPSPPTPCGPGPGGPAGAQAGPQRKDRIRRDCPTPRRPGPGHHRGPGRRRAETLRGRSPDLGRRGAVGRRHRPTHGPEG